VQVAGLAVAQAGGLMVKLAVCPMVKLAWVVVMPGGPGLVGS